MLKKTWRKFITFCFVGFFAFILDWGIFNLTYLATSFFSFSLTMGWIISMIFNFSANRNVTFKAKGISISKQLTKWIFIYAIAFLARIGTGEVMLFFFKETTFTANIAYLCGILVMVPISFFGSLLWVFKKK